MAVQMNEMQKFIHVSKYARWIEEEQRRETTWEETATRYLDFMKGRNPEVQSKTWKLIEHHMMSLGVLPSMRAVQMAGPALARNNVMGYNCAYLPFESLKDIADLLYILMCGTGVGFSTEKQYIDQMPTVQPWVGFGAGVFVIEDTTEGWADSLLAGLQAWFSGKDIEFDYSKIRPRGTRLKTKGGRASGPDPLRKLHEFCRNTINGAQGRKLTSLEWLDIGNMIGDIVVVGGVRRAAEINFSDVDDDLIRHAKDWPFPQYRQNSNNSAVYYSKPSAFEFMKEWAALANSGTGERGFFNLTAVEKRLPARRKFTKHMRGNPCLEILLRPRQFCNLSEVVVRPEDDFDDLVQKVKAAVWLGAMQARLTDFPYIHPDFKKNCEEEALLGVSLTGQMDNPKLFTPEKLQILKKYAVKEGKKAAACLGINFAAAITTGKPSGTVSKLVNCGDGMHPWQFKHGIRRNRINATDPVYHLMRSQGMKFDPENGQGPDAIVARREKLVAAGRSEEEARILVPDWHESQVDTWVFGVPYAAPKGAITKDQITAIEQLEWYKKLVDNWCEHNQSVTIYVRDEEWLKVGAWVYDHFDDLVGVSFLPYSGGKYKLAPYEELTKEQYDQLVKETPKIDYSKLSEFEQMDMTTGAQQYACVGGACQLD